MSISFEPRLFTARDGTQLRAGVFDGGTRGLCVLLHGQTEFIEKYDEVIGELRARGFSVATLDWRSQGLSGRSLEDTRKIHVGDFADYDSDLKQFWREIVEPLGGAKITLAHSMGGHLLLRALHHNPQLVQAAILSAPMLRVNLRGYPESVARMVALGMCTGRRGGEFVWGTEAFDPRRVSFAENFVTRDERRFSRWQESVRANDALCVNGPTWGWLNAALSSMRVMTRNGFAEQITTPMLICAAGADRVVDTNTTRDFARRVPGATYVEIAGSEHEILMERDEIRAQFWKAFDAFAERRAL